MFDVTSGMLEKICTIGQFDIDDEVVVLGLRSCLPTSETDLAFRKARSVDLQAKVDYERPKCTIGIWDRGKGLVSIYAGSTVPLRKYVAASALRRKEESDTNQMCECLIAYRKDKHAPNKPVDMRYDALIQDAIGPFQRSFDDDDYEENDAYFVGLPGDNIHCAFVESSRYPGYSSQGCQVVTGYAARPRYPAFPDAGAWKHFRDAIYAGKQKRFLYLLTTGEHAQSVVTSPPKAIPARLSFGSTGPLVKTVQQALKDRGHAITKVDGKFGEQTFYAVRAFQSVSRLTADGIVGLHTAEFLDLGSAWPKY